MSSRRTSLAVLLVAALGGHAYANDPWELGEGDDGISTHNMIRHGESQVHDLEGTPPGFDQDWTRVFAQARHSYEARVSGLYWDNGCAGAPCPRLARVNDAGAVLTAGNADDDDLVIGPEAAGQTVRWTATAAGPDRLRVTGDQLFGHAATPYTILFRDTTLLVPRWNSTGTQTTVLVLQNAQSVAIEGSIHFYNAAGTLVQSVGINVPAYGVNVLSTGSLPPLAGLSGSAQVSHTGRYGGLTGKAVALEPSTGFTFDTVMAPIPY